MLTRRSLLGAAIFCALGAVEALSVQEALDAMMRAGPQDQDHEGAREPREGDAASLRLCVEGTRIDYPLAHDRPGLPEGYYLDHDAVGRRSALGCPFIDRRSPADGCHLLVYGHNTGASMFSEIEGTWRRADFEALGRAELSGGAGWRKTFMPVCSMRVDRGFPDIQRFAFRDEDDLRGWLRGLGERASARAASWREQIDAAGRALTLVTCATPRPGERERALSVFTG